MPMIELIGEQLLNGNKDEGKFLFSYKPTEDTPKSCGIKELSLSFVYAKGKIPEYIQGFILLGSMLAHNPYWASPTTKFSDSEINRIALLPVYDGFLPNRYMRNIKGISLEKERSNGTRQEYVFAFNREDNKRLVPMKWGFMYAQEVDKKIKYGNCLLASIYEHNQGWENPKTKFSDEKLNEILNMKINKSYVIDKY